MLLSPITYLFLKYKLGELWWSNKTEADEDFKRSIYIYIYYEKTWY